MATDFLLHNNIIFLINPCLFFSTKSIFYKYIILTACYSSWKYLLMLCLVVEHIMIWLYLGAFHLVISTPQYLHCGCHGGLKGCQQEWNLTVPEVGWAVASPVSCPQLNEASWNFDMSFCKVSTTSSVSFFIPLPFHVVRDTVMISSHLCIMITFFFSAVRDY